MAAAALLSVTLVPALMVLFVRGRIIPEHKNPINRFLIWIYRPVIKARAARQDAGDPARARRSGGHDLAGAATRHRVHAEPERRHAVLHADDAARAFRSPRRPSCCRRRTGSSRSFPEVASVYGKAGRAATATDPAPTEMFETIINLKPKAEWRPGVTVDGLIAEMDKALQFPGVSNAWTMPIKARIDMLSTGIRTPVGVKVIGTDLAEIDKLARQIEQVLQDGAGHLDRLRRARHRRLLSRHHAGPRGARALRPHGPGRAGRDRDRARRRDRDHDGRRPRALQRQHALSARSAQRSAGRSRATCWCRCRPAARCRSARSPRSS